jgi:predicted TIM-barrel fold metal-dependent hydrolase
MHWYRKEGDMPDPGTREWLDQVIEPIVDPAREIVDPHHHLWRLPGFEYVLDDLWADTSSGHNVVKTVFVECNAEYRETGPEYLKPVGETEFVRAVAAASRRHPEAGTNGRAVISAIVAHADLTDGDHLDEVLDAHESAAEGLFRGIRHAGARDPNPEALMIAGRAPEGLYGRSDFRRGVTRLGERGYTYDTWHYHHQNPAFAELARAVPGTTIVLDHFGTPLGVGPYAGKRAEIYERWRKDITAIAACPNVVAKLGGLAMPDNGFGWNTRATPATSDELVAAQQDYYLHTIDAFGPDRCMFESNFPVDRFSLSYPIYWNAMKKIAARFSEAEQTAMFSGTASRIYRL